MIKNKKLTVITPTTGRKNLIRLIDTIRTQNNSDEIYHIILWDDFRQDDSQDLNFEQLNNEHTLSIYIPGDLGTPYGSHLRSVGLMLAQTPWVTFADDDVWWEPNHYDVLKEIMDGGFEWGGVRRVIWNPYDNERIGVDNFESVGDSPARKTPYEMLDGNTMIFKREYGVYAAPVYREITTYDDDRKMYAYLKECSSSFKLLTTPSINQVCPNKLVNMFQSLCD
jgi:glycosyltransferase involved in cell wall biosynthesis